MNSRPAEPERAARDLLDSGLHPCVALARHWHLLGPPLRPCDADIRRLDAAWRQSLPASSIPARRLEILSLGVTPEIARHDWAADIFLTAVDASEEMIRAVWPGDGARRRAVRGDWLKLPSEAGSFDLILSDCGLTPLAEPGRIAALSRELRRVIRDEGRIVMRHLARPARSPSPAELAEATMAGRIAGFHELKLRLLMALERPGAGAALDEVWACFESHFPDRRALAQRLGCSLATVGTIDAYREQPARYVFPSLDELAESFADFSLKVGPVAQYALGECCPVFSLTPRP